ncbi:helix-turn-helix transcriptional regulator [Mesorhizobium sp. IMUNJ 23033]|uniref:LexA family transcriptional regulator n=1 Tax=Mesorhizobium sp. IMUNJ 23033 TaxID=3378039 RepID=UPI00384E0992
MMDPRHRLQQARAEAGYASPSDASRALRDINKNTLISHENGNRPLSRKAAEKYGRLFGVDPGWLLFDGNPAGSGGFHEAGSAALMPSPLTVDVPIVSWISAGELGSQDSVVNLSDYPTIPAADLEQGEWIALRVDGPSMNKISPPDSIIFVNLRDKRLVTNGCYVISDESGRATYKRYRPNDKPPFQPASYMEIPPPELEGAITIIGRVKRSMIDM